MVLNSVIYAQKNPKCIREKNEDCNSIRAQQNAFIEQYTSSSLAPSLILLHIPPFDNEAGYDNQAKPLLYPSPLKVLEYFSEIGYNYPHYEISSAQ